MTVVPFPQPAWMADAACTGHNPDLWFPDMGKPGTQAKAICATCPVRVECLDYAVANHERHGIFGGLAPKERLRLQAGRRRT